MVESSELSRVLLILIRVHYHTWGSYLILRCSLSLRFWVRGRIPTRKCIFQKTLYKISKLFVLKKLQFFIINTVEPVKHLTIFIAKILILLKILSHDILMPLHLVELKLFSFVCLVIFLEFLKSRWTSILRPFLSKDSTILILPNQLLCISHLQKPRRS